MENSTKVFVAFLTLLFFLLIVAYASQLGDESIASVRATRPILVFTLIVAMLGFGGMLMAKSLFGKEDAADFQLRFRHAREVFLVYAGIFGTIIGFYFGAADEPDITTSPTPTIAFRGETISVQVSGGTPPFVGYIQQTDPPLDVLLKGGDTSRLLTAELDGQRCPDQATVYIVDGRGRQGKLDVKNSDLTGWTGDCPATGTVGNTATPAAGNATDDAGANEAAAQELP